MRNIFFYLTRKIIPYRTILNDQDIIIDKKKQNHTTEYISVDQKNIKTLSSVKLLGAHIDDQLNFNLQITKKKALIRLRMFLNFEEKKTLITSYFYSNFNYYSLVWVFSSAKSLSKVESLQKRAYFFFMKTMFRCMRSYCKNLCLKSLS